MKVGDIKVDTVVTVFNVLMIGVGIWFISAMYYEVNYTEYVCVESVVIEEIVSAHYRGVEVRTVGGEVFSIDQPRPRVYAGVDYCVKRERVEL